MKIKEVLQNCKNEFIKIGCNGASEWWYAGKADQVDIEDCNKALLAWREKRICNAQKSVLKQAGGILTPSDWVKKEIKDGEGGIKLDVKIDLEEYKNYLIQAFQETSRLIGIVGKRKQELEDFVPLENREVVDVFKANSIVDKDCLCIMVEGIEM